MNLGKREFTSGSDSSESGYGNDFFPAAAEKADRNGGLIEVPMEEEPLHHQNQRAE